ncbi:hypothetical protein JCM19046_4010 [Bacillus sp. JCM 19046]|nr:hypothetical protein JCM19046_4010 [Bacillus sp. JCM 19046]
MECRFRQAFFFTAKGFLSCAFHDGNGKLNSWVKPLNGKTLLQAFMLALTTTPFWFKSLLLLVVALVLVPKILPIGWNGLPYYALIYLLFGTHFIFPSTLKQYHGAEHKIFSMKGRINKHRLSRIRKASICNRGCSTSLVVVYFLSVMVILLGCWVFFPFSKSLAIASYAAVLVVAIYHLFHRSAKMAWVERLILPLSYWLQTKLTTKEPERKHLLCAIESYQKLGYQVFSDALIDRKIERRRRKKMAIADVTIIPVGTGTPSVSSYVVEVHKRLQKLETEYSLKYQLTPMSTLIEAEVPTLYKVLEELHKVPFEHGAERVALNIRIDDRRDQSSSLEKKLKTVNDQLKDSRN